MRPTKSHLAACSGEEQVRQGVADVTGVLERKIVSLIRVKFMKNRKFQYNQAEPITE